MSSVLWAGLILALYALLCASVWLRHRRRLQREREEAAALLPAAGDAAPVLVLHASQTGTAEELAWQTARALHLAGQPVRLATLGEIGLAELHAATHALFIVSTYGEGDPPDSAAAFARKLMDAAPELAHLQTGVLALGDRSYGHFCGFGRTLAAWLQACGARPLFAPIEVDKSDPQALEQWRQSLSHVAGTLDLPDWDAPRFAHWRLAARTQLNPGSSGGPVFHLELAPPAGEPLPDWEAGDLVQLQVEGDDKPREYTIASIPADGGLQLMVRLTTQADGSPGAASGTLCLHTPIGGSVALRLRRHASFRIGDNAARALILVGNGTGLAGLRAHLKARSATQPGCWLIYGERQAAHDAHYRADIEAWQASGVLARADWVFSRDQAERRHVQHLLDEQCALLQRWLADGAAVYVCGSLQGMAGAVDDVLRLALGDEGVAQLIEQGRYRRDVY